MNMTANIHKLRDKWFDRLCGMTLIMAIVSPLASSGCAESTPLASEPQQAKSASLAEADAQSLLSSAPLVTSIFPRLDVKFVNTEFIFVLADIQLKTDLEMKVNWESLEAAGVSSELPITFRARNMRADRVLRFVLTMAGKGSELDPIGFLVVDDVIHISTVRDLPYPIETRVYDIRDLLVQLPNFETAPEFDINSALG